MDRYLVAAHHSSAEGWAVSKGFRYMKVEKIKQLEPALDKFVMESDAPILLEVFTDKLEDAKLLNAFYAKNSGANVKEKVMGEAKRFAKSALSGKVLEAVAKIGK